MIGLYLSVIDPVATGQEMNLSAASETQLIEQVQTQLQAGVVPSGQQVHTFNIIYMMDADNYIPDSFFSALGNAQLWGQSARLIGFLALFIGFAIKLPSFPVHTWLPDAHVEASTAISVVLAGLLLKVGAYGFIRLAYSIFPDGAIHYAYWIGLFGLISIIYGSLNALGYG